MNFRGSTIKVKTAN